MKYQVDFSKLTIFDIAPLMTKNIDNAQVIIFADKVIVGGVMHLPPSELFVVINLALTEFKKWYDSLFTPAAISDALEDILKDIKGL